MEQIALFDRILEEMGAGTYVEEVKRARDEYFTLISELQDDDPSYERLTASFLNWYILDRPLGKLGTPLQVFAARPELGEQERSACSRLAANIYSLFEVLRVEPGGVRLQDLFTLEEIRVGERRHLAGLERGDLLEARLVPLEDRLVFASGASLHPRQASGIIKAAVERSRLEGQPSPVELLRALQALSFRYVDRFRERVPADKVYAELGSESAT
ncbi:MAG: hypothetical protein JXR96_03270 [Deltaproteobacteria bacterium]|nr:hypothetical protein [Deltaproteobacteria bacterium]